MFRRLSVGLLAALSVTALIAGCSSSKKSSSPPPTSTAPQTSASSSAAQTSAASSPSSASGASSAGGALPAGMFGPGCATLGLNKPALAGATAAPVGTVAPMMPFLSDVVQAATVAGMLPTFNTAPAITVFAPVNDAFKKEPAGELQSMLTDPSKKPLLVATLKYGVVSGKLSQAQLPGKHTTLEGAPITVTGSGDNYTINGTAKILCGGIQTKNATVYLLDTVLHPPAS